MEQRCGPCKELGNPDVIAHYQSYRNTQGKTVPAMCFAHRHGQKPGWLLDQERKTGKVTPEPEAKTGLLAAPLNQSGKLVEETKFSEVSVVRTHDVKGKPEQRHLEKRTVKTMNNEPETTEIGKNVVPCERRVSPNCARYIDANKKRKICKACLSYLILEGKKNKAAERRLEKFIPEKSKFDEAKALELGAQAMVEAAWERATIREKAEAADTIFSQLTLLQKMAMVRTVLTFEDEPPAQALQPPAGVQKSNGVESPDIGNGVKADGSITLAYEAGGKDWPSQEHNVQEMVSSSMAKMTNVL